MHAQAVEAVQQSWAQIEPLGDRAARVFYDQLFKLDPQLKALFKGDMTRQGQRLMQMIGLAVRRLGAVETLLTDLRALGQRHQGYGVMDRDYATVGAALIETLALALGEAFTPAVRQAWLETYGLLSEAMRSGARAEAAERQADKAGVDLPL